jgi:hypothetical protein
MSIVEITITQAGAALCPWTQVNECKRSGVGAAINEINLRARNGCRGSRQLMHNDVSNFGDRT